MVFREIVSKSIVVAGLMANSIVGAGEWAALSGAAKGSFVEAYVQDPAKPTKPIFRVPLIDISKLPPAAALQGRLSALAQICD